MDNTFDPAACIASECDATRNFIDLLRCEQRVLEQADVFTLASLTKEKTHQVQQLAQLADARNRWLVTLGYAGDRSGMESVLNDRPAASALWKELLQLAETAVHLNKTNGVLIDQRLRYNQQALTILQAATQNSGLYGSDGQSRPFSRGRQLGEG
ncbi:flagella synthesis protein FlgN [Nitrosovibrio tenuis]|uniref:Flagella synthesis protein FlgN n=1 Tax=Nitrosovibrio tenuis TaxID=1233 RepID=A0A1H7J9C6_9PROT|nr:flagellar protein FlgN [Nitrosovibrio tenuis]SEK70580.1 flagella synthesis protein FlgN [Nitrosovibrio tenuis]